ncbi:MAG: sulfatase-like hydrolase/transferase [Gammaproteobacteria bacterium]
MTHSQLSPATANAGAQRFRALIPLMLWYVVLGAVLRITLWARFAHTEQMGAWQLGWALPAGAAADVIQSLYLLAPFALYLWLVPDRLYRSRAGQLLVLVCAFAWVFGFTFLAAVEYFFFDEFDSRLNLVAVDYLMYPTEVVGDIWASYPVVPVVVVIGILSAVTLYWRRQSLTNASAPPSRLLDRTVPFALFIVALLGVAFFFDTYALAWSANRVTNEVAVNGGSSFFRALRTNEIEYPAYYATREPGANLHALQKQLGSDGTFTRLAEGRVDRRFPGNPNGLGKLNVVVISSESFGAEFSKLYGSDRNFTPEFDAFAGKSVWFRHMYASGTRTVRGLEAISTSLPPIPSVSVLRRPGNEGIANWGEVMRKNGYHTSFLYGGYGYFDNMNYFFEHNGFEVRDRTQIPKPVRFANIWGVADEDLFDAAMRHFDDVSKAGQPFFSIVMTTSNHKPFTFRAGVPNVKEKGGGRESGVRYADFAQGYFLREAAKHAWFDNTLFIIVADHGARVYGRQDIPLKTYEIPMLFYSPKHLKPRQVDTLTTQIDIAPTVLGLLGFAYEAPFFGEDVLHTRNQTRVAFFSHNHDVALYKDGELSILGLGKTVQNVMYDESSDSYRPAPLNPELNNLAVAYYQTAFELFRSHRYD